MENEILIFRTSISKKQDIKGINKVLSAWSDIEKWNVDFEDWEKILRIECNGISVSEITEALRKEVIGRLN